MVETNFTKAEEIAKGFEIMEEYMNESSRVITDIDFGESYDREWANRDECYREGREDGEKGKQIEIARNLIMLNLSLEDISKATGLEIIEIEKLKKDGNFS